MGGTEYSVGTAGVLKAKLDFNDLFSLEVTEDRLIDKLRARAISILMTANSSGRC
jgi:hypothetical protein